MKLLIQAALRNRRHYILLLVTLISMIFLTISSQLEMFALPVITNSGADFFKLFASEGQVQAESLTLTEVGSKWTEIAGTGHGAITQVQATAFLASKDGRLDFISQAVHFINSFYNISDDLRHLAIFLVVIAAFKAVSFFLHHFSMKLVAIRVSRDLRLSYFEHLQALPMSFYHRYNIGSLSARVVGDAGTVAQSINAFLINYLQTPFQVVSTLVLCCCTSMKLSMLVFLGFPLIVAPIVLLARKIKHLAKQVQRNQENFSTVLLDFLTGVQTVKVFAREDYSLGKYKEQNERMAKLEERSAKYNLMTRPILHMISSMVVAFVILYGLFWLQMRISEILFFCGLLYLFYEPIKKFAEHNQCIMRGVAAAERMYEVLDLQPDIQDRPEAVTIKDFQRQIEFDNVWFRYGDEWVLKGLSFQVGKGETVALVGPTGAGKSTVAQLLPRLYEVEKGEIRIDGKPLQDYTQKSLREILAFVPQKPFLFLDSVGENISFGQDFSEAEIKDAAFRAQAHDFISNLPEAYDTRLEDAGRNLSGGQQQRVAIARALVKKSPILVLDEATSSLDGISENKIKEALEAMHGEITQIIIAHRFSTIEKADRIIYLEEGQKVAEGSRDELLESCPNFRIMWEMMNRSQEQKPEALGSGI